MRVYPGVLTSGVSGLQIRTQYDIDPGDLQVSGTMFPSFLPHFLTDFSQSLWIRNLLDELFPTVYNVLG